MGIESCFSPWSRVEVVYFFLLLPPPIHQILIQVLRHHLDHPPPTLYMCGAECGACGEVFLHHSISEYTGSLLSEVLLSALCSVCARAADIYAAETKNLTVSKKARNTRFKIRSQMSRVNSKKRCEIAFFPCCINEGCQQGFLRVNWWKLGIFFKS